MELQHLPLNTQLILTKLTIIQKKLIGTQNVYEKYTGNKCNYVIYINCYLFESRYKTSHLIIAGNRYRYYNSMIDIFTNEKYL